jgi:hypothetical protein
VTEVPIWGITTSTSVAGSVTKEVIGGDPNRLDAGQHGLLE